MAKTLVLDIGNTRCKVGLFDAQQLKKTWVFNNGALPDPKEFTTDKALTIVVSNVGSVVLPPSYTEHITIDYQSNLPVKLAYVTPKDVGADRLANACALMYEKEAAMVIDAGTCITYDVVVNQTFIGGAIGPGLHMRLRAMHNQTQKLPLLNVKVPEASFPYNTTADNMQGAAYHGAVAEVAHFIELFKGQYPLGKAVITGGDAIALQKGLKSNIFAHPNLTLQGIYNIYKHQYA